MVHYIAKCGSPWNFTKSHINWYLQAFYFLDKWHFGVQYQSNKSSMDGYDGYLKGAWANVKDAYTAIIGWGNTTWNVQMQLANPFRWNWRYGSTILKSTNYDYTQTNYNVNRHCYINVSATYTFGFGKKIKVGNEATQQTGASSAILE